ncbi:MAG: glycosyltransferase [Cyanobacteria bacterium J06635_1]
MLTICPQLSADDRLLVVADNCTDNTAAVAAAAGASVIKRRNESLRGKGYALDFGLQHLAQSPPDVVIIVDADCRVSPGSIALLSQTAIAAKRPVQGTYLLELPTKPSAKAQISAFAFKIKNLVRPLGCRWLGQPSPLTGTGMAFPWSVLSAVDLASDNLVEDMKLGLDLALAGYPPIFCREALILSELPQTDKGAVGQRTRWEHGHLQVLRQYVPKLLMASLHQRRFDLTAMALDLCVPPLALLVMLWAGISAFTTLAAWWLAAGWIVFPSYLAGGLMLGGILLAWVGFAKEDLPLKQLLSVPFYILWKLPIYLSFLTKPQSKWIRTERDS